LDERQRALFTTLAEAIDWISKQRNYSRRAATLWIREALAYEVIGPLLWEDGLMDYPPVGRQFWLAEARIRRGRVFDPSAKRWRTLLIGKHSIFQIWREPHDQSGQATENGSNVVPITKTKGGRPSAKEEIHQALDKLSHKKGRSVKDTRPRKKLAEQVAEKCGKLLGKSPGWSLGVVLDHIRDWAKKH
jgi:hypothetical protein